MTTVFPIMVMVATLVVTPSLMAMPTVIMMMVMPVHSLTLDDNFFGTGHCRSSQTDRRGCSK